jgi:hypothetical protein
VGGWEGRGHESYKYTSLSNTHNSKNNITAIYYKTVKTSNKNKKNKPEASFQKLFMLSLRIWGGGRGEDCL